MVAIDFPYLCSDRDRHGTVRWYFRAPGSKRKVRIRAEFGTEAFGIAYWAIRNGDLPTPIARVAAARPGTFRFIVQHYYRSAEFKALDARYTQVERRAVLDALVEKIGDKPAVITPQTIRQALQVRVQSAARKFLSAVRHVYAIALEAGLVNTDPTVGIKAKKPKTDGFHSWTAAERALYEKRWPVGTKQHTAYALGRYLQARRSDAVVLGKPHLKGEVIRYKQQKNRQRAPVWIEQPIVPPLRAALDGCQGAGLTFLETREGLPYSVKGFGDAFARWCAAAELPDHCTFHGLRKGTAAEMAEAGESSNRIKAALGDRTLQQAELYTRAADQARMAKDAIEGLFGEQIVPPVSDGGTVSAKKA